MMQLQSQFKPWTFYLSGLFILLTGLLVFSTVMFLSTQEFRSFSVLLFFVLFVFIWIWILLGEIRTKAIKVNIKMDTIVVSRYVGPGRKQTFNFSEFDGFKTSLLPSEYEDYEFLYIMAGKKKLLSCRSFTTKTILNSRRPLPKDSNAQAMKSSIY